MIIAGLPYPEADPGTTQSGATPYGASHVAGLANDRIVSEAEKRLCMALGKRLAQTAIKLST